MAKGAGTTRTSTSSAPKGIAGGGSNPVNVVDYKFVNYNEGNGETTMTLAKMYARQIESAYAQATTTANIKAGRTEFDFMTASEPNRSIRELFMKSEVKRRVSRGDVGFGQLDEALRKRKRHIQELLRKVDKENKK